jgi:hypothetical protein
MVLSSIAGTTTSMTSASLVSNIDSSVARQVEDRKSLKEVGNMISTEEYVKKYFSDIPIMVEIAKCESRFRHLDRDGRIIRGLENSQDVGVMQINEHYHLDISEKKDLNIYTIEGNTAYARDLYERQGTKPWNSSKACWGKYLAENKDSKSLAINK